MFAIIASLRASPSGPGLHAPFASHCASYDDCALRRVLRALGGSWGGVKIWNTEDGIGREDDVSRQPAWPDPRAQHVYIP